MQLVFEVAAVTCVGCVNVHRIMGSPAEIPVNYNSSLCDNNCWGENGKSFSNCLWTFKERNLFGITTTMSNYSG